MGHKVSPKGIRLAVFHDWNASWYAKSKDFSTLLLSDLKARAFLKKELEVAGVSSIKIQRPAHNAKITVHLARPGVVIGKKGEFIERLAKAVGRIMHVPVSISLEEVRKPELDAKLVAENIAQQLKRRIMFRRAIKRGISTAMRAGAKGIRINLSGRLGGAEIARNEWAREGRVPLHTFRADIDYGLAEAETTYGVIGVKVWIYKGEVFSKNNFSLKNLDLHSKPKKQEKNKQNFFPKRTTNRTLEAKTKT